MARRHASVPGKIILTGEYAVLFGYPGIAVPAPVHMDVTFQENPEASGITIEWDVHELWLEYAQKIVSRCKEVKQVPSGHLTITSTIPLGKGMGSSTALVIAIAGVLLDTQYKKPAMAIEDELNPGHSGIDFAVMWNRAPIVFQKGSEPKVTDVNIDLHGALLIDTGEPHEQTPELVSWVTERKTELEPALKTIGSCSKRLLNNEDLASVIRDHHQAQVTLGIVTEEAKNLITKIEQSGGAAKVIGAGSRTRGCGMVLALNCDASVIDSRYDVLPL